MHGNILDERLELLVLGNEVGFAVHLDEHPDLAAGMDIGADGPLAGNAAGLLGGRGKSLLAEIVDSLFMVSTGFGQGPLAVHETGAGYFSQFVYLCSGYAHVIPPSSRQSGVFVVTSSQFPSPQSRL